MPELKFYTCSLCGGTFQFDPQDDAEALADMARDFPGVPMEEMTVVCEDCYKRLMGPHKARLN